MLQRLREKAQGWFAWLILGAIAVTFVLFGTSSYFSSAGPNQSVAKVNGSSITERDLDIAYQRALQGPGSETLRYIDPSLVKAELLQTLIEEKILLQNAKKMGMTVSNEKLTEMLKEIPFLHDSKGNFSQEAYLRFLASSNYTDSSFREVLRDNMLQQQLRESVAGTALSLPVDISDYVKYSLQKRDFRYTTLDKDIFQKKITVVDDELQKYYESHAKEFMTPERISLEYVHLSLPELAKTVQYTDKDIQEFYRDNLSTFTTPATAHVAHILVSASKESDPSTQEAAKAKITNIKNELKAGKSFSELAKEYSDDKMTADKGGELQWFTAGEMLPEFEKAAFALNADQVSEPVQTDFGFHLIKLIDKKPEHVKPLFEVKEDVIAKYKQHQAEERLIQLSEDVSQIAFDSPDSLQPVSDKVGTKIEKTELFSQEEGPKSELLNRPEVMTAAFSSNVKDHKNNSDLIKLDNDNYLVVRLDELVPSKQKLFEDVKAEIKETLLAEKTNDLLKNEAANLAKTLINSKDMPDAKALGDYNWSTKDNVVRTERNVDANLLETAFSMARASDQDNRVIKTTKLANGDYAVVWLLDVKDGTVDMLSEADKKNYQTGLERQWGQLEFALYVTDLISKAKVKTSIPSTAASQSE